MPTLSGSNGAKHGIPNIEKHIANSSETYAKAIAIGYPTSERGVGSNAFVLEGPEKQSQDAGQARRLLRRVRCIPGTDRHGNVDADQLKVWLGELRSSCERQDCVKIGDNKIGELLANAPEGDGLWPCRPVCEALEWMSSKDIGEAFIVGALNRRGVYTKGKGGDKERELANQYRAWAGRFVYEFPYVAGLLDHVARIYDKEAKMEDAVSEVGQRFSL